MSPAEQLAFSIVQRLQNAGHTAYYAGGCVRDRLMTLPPKDFDVATSATPPQVLTLFPRAQKVGAAFGVILVRQKTSDEIAQVEVATFRADGVYSDGRHPDSVRFTNAQEDAQRRDFTCNGLFFDPVANQLHDFVGGQQDIASKTLRAIGRPDARFAEDHLRLLRAIRFAARLGFTIEAATFDAIIRLAEKIRTISKERIHDELARILTHPTRATAADLLHKSSLLQYLWPPELVDDPGNDRSWIGLGWLPPDADFVQALFTLYLDFAVPNDSNPAVVAPPLRFDGNTVSQILRRDLLLNNTETADLAWFLDHRLTLLNWEHMPKSRLKRLLADSRWEKLETLFVILSLDPAKRGRFDRRIAEMKAEGVAPQPFITGEALIKMGASPGPRFKAWLEALYDRQLDGELTTADQAAAAAQKLIASH